MMYCGVSKLVHCVACFLCAVCALHVGLLALGYDLYKFIPFLEGNEMYLNYIFGIAGAISLTLLVMHVFMPSCYCCNSNNSPR